jgi:hypothetical protein
VLVLVLVLVGCSLRKDDFKGDVDVEVNVARIFSLRNSDADSRQQTT